MSKILKDIVSTSASFTSQLRAPLINVTLSPPAVQPNKGMLIYDIVSNSPYIGNGSSWVQIGGGGGSPTGPAGGVLAGTYPNPTLAPGAVTSTALAPGSVTSGALAPGAVTSAALAPGSVTSSALAPGAVTSSALADTAVVPNTYGNATTVPQITVDQKGRITGVTPVAISAGGSGTVTNIATTVGQLTGGPITTTGTLGLADTAVVPNTYGDATTVPQISVDQKGRITGVTPVAITAGSVTNIATTVGQLTGGPITTTGTLGLADTAVVPNTYGDATTVPQITVDQKGRITGVTPVAISGGGGYVSGTDKILARFTTPTYGPTIGSNQILVWDSTVVTGTGITYNAGTGVFTIVNAGIFHISLCAAQQSIPTGAANIYIDSTAFPTAEIQCILSAVAYAQSCVSLVISAGPGTFSVKCFQGGFTFLCNEPLGFGPISSTTYFQITRIG